jgi:sorting nexin-4
LKFFLLFQNTETFYKQRRSGDGVLENLGDALLNAFSKIKKPDERFIEIKENIDKFEENLQTIERLYFKIIKRQSGIIILCNFGLCIEF